MLEYRLQAWSCPQVHLCSLYQNTHRRQGLAVITKKSQMFKISLFHTNGFIGKTKPNQNETKQKPQTNIKPTKLTKQMHTNVWCDLRSTGVFSQIREGFSYLEMGRGAGGSSRPSSRPGTLNTLSCSNHTWGAKSHGDGLSLGPHRDSGVSTSRNEQLSQRSAILSGATTTGRQASKDTIHTAILSWAHTPVFPSILKPILH